MHEHEVAVRRRAMDRERKRMVRERQERMRGYARRSIIHIIAGAIKRGKGKA